VGCQEDEWCGEGSKQNHLDIPQVEGRPPPPPSANWINGFLNFEATASRNRASKLLNERGETGSVTLDGPKRGDLANTVQAFEQYICDFDSEKKAKEKMTAKQKQDAVSSAEKEEEEEASLHRGGPLVP